MTIREDVPELNVVECDELVYWDGFIDGGYGHLLIHATREGRYRRLRHLSLASEDEAYFEFDAGGGWETGSWW